MGLVMKTIGDSIQQPIDIGEGGGTLTTSEETPGTDDRRWRVFFRLPSLRKRSQSHGFIASSAKIEGSIDNVSHRSSSASIAGAGMGTGRPDESEIKDFQKTLINLPIYEVDTHRAPLAAGDGRDDSGGGLSMSRFSSVPDQLEYLHVLSAQLMDKERGQKGSASTAMTAGGKRLDVAADTVPALPSDGRGSRGDTSNGGGGGGSRRRRALPSSSSTSSRESAALPVGGGGSGRRSKLHSDSSTSRAGTSTLTPLPSEPIVFHFAAATPCESPISLADQPLMTFTDMSTTVETLSEDNEASGQPLVAAESTTPRISPPPPAAGSLSGSRGSLTVRPNNLWSLPSSRDAVASPSRQSTSSSLSPMSSINRNEPVASAAAVHSPNLSLILPCTPGCSEVPGPDSGCSQLPGTSSGCAELPGPVSGCSEVPAPVSHRAVMMIMERWVDASGGVDLDSTPLVKKEMKDFLGKMASLGVEYRSWTHRIRDKLKLEVSCLAVVRYAASRVRLSYEIIV